MDPSYSWQVLIGDGFDLLARCIVAAHIMRNSNFTDLVPGALEREINVRLAFIKATAYRQKHNRDE